ncbi:MAG: methyltransferase domain-containing protein [Bacteroidales bacterium]|nr:methyltransferase domain-containing protein [Bacteroidales bacterium]
MKTLIRFLLQNIPRKYLQRVAIAGSRLMVPFLKGHQIECPVCGKHFRKLLPYGYVISRKNALCPHCLSLERHRLIWLFLKRETPFFTQPCQVLHLAPEYCFMKYFSAVQGEGYITADLESPWAKVKMNVEEIPFPENHFDVILCNHLLEHVEDDRKALRELFRVLKPGGWALLQSPVDANREKTYEDRAITSPEEREKHFGQKDHLRAYGKDYTDRLREAGFTVNPLDYVAILGEDLQKRYALPQNELIYYAEKK